MLLFELEKFIHYIYIFFISNNKDYIKDMKTFYLIQL